MVIALSLGSTPRRSDAMVFMECGSLLPLSTANKAAASHRTPKRVNGPLLIQELIQIHQLIGQHRPGGQGRRIKTWIGFRLADREQLNGQVRLRLIMGAQPGQRGLDDRLLIGTEWPRQKLPCDEV